MQREMVVGRDAFEHPAERELHSPPTRGLVEPNAAIGQAVCPDRHRGQDNNGQHDRQRARGLSKSGLLARWITGDSARPAGPPLTSPLTPDEAIITPSAASGATSTK